MYINTKLVGIFAAGFAAGTAGLRILTSKDAKKVYTNCTAAVLRVKDDVVEKATILQENCGDILAEAKAINKKRAAAEAVIDDLPDDEEDELAGANEELKQSAEEL